jgi:hypothetical protein
MHTKLVKLGQRMNRIFTWKRLQGAKRIDVRKLRFELYLGMSGSSDTAYTTYYA